MITYDLELDSLALELNGADFLRKGARKTALVFLNS